MSNGTGLRSGGASSSSIGAAARLARACGRRGDGASALAQQTNASVRVGCGRAGARVQKRRNANIAQANASAAMFVTGDLGSVFEGCARAGQPRKRVEPVQGVIDRERAAGLCRGTNRFASTTVLSVLSLRAAALHRVKRALRSAVVASDSLRGAPAASQHIAERRARFGRRWRPAASSRRGRRAKPRAGSYSSSYWRIRLRRARRRVHMCGTAAPPAARRRDRAGSAATTTPCARRRWPSTSSSNRARTS
mmetsp:Transcript_30955/g.92939  ORF Transcript_30955/g.92939 Transcript_30955/m.92939 type:complete len:251 (+) Transcript_30955:314-1066(+)